MRITDKVNTHGRIRQIPDQKTFSWIECIKSKLRTWIIATLKLTRTADVDGFVM